MLETITVTAEDGESRLDRWFRRHYPELGHGRLEKLLRTGQVRVDGKRAKSGDRVSPGQAIRVPPLGEADTTPQVPRPHPANDSALRDLIIHRDDHAIVINKPAGLAVQGGSNTTRHVDGLLDGLRFGNDERPRLVHRLDKDTSGVLLIARSAAAAAFFTRAFRDKATHKIYWAIVAGVPKLPRGKIDLSLAKGVLHKGGGRERVHPDEAGRDAVTYYTVVDIAGDRASWLALLPLTGRTHQLRAHCAAMGTPILGDGKYGGAAAHALGAAAAHRLHLHARALEIPHPSGFTLKVTAPLPPHMRRMWDFLGFAADAPDPFAELELTP